MRMKRKRSKTTEVEALEEALALVKQTWKNKPQTTKVKNNKIMEGIQKNRLVDSVEDSMKNLMMSHLIFIIGKSV